MSLLSLGRLYILEVEKSSSVAANLHAWTLHIRWGNVVDEEPLILMCTLKYGVENSTKWFGHLMTVNGGVHASYFIIELSLSFFRLLVRQMNGFSTSLTMKENRPEKATKIYIANDCKVVLWVETF